MPSWNIFSSQSSIPLANSHLKSLARQEHCTLLPWEITHIRWTWQPFWYLVICFNAYWLCFVFKTEQGQHICLRVDICLCWALFHESQVSVTDLRQILQFTGKKMRTSIHCALLETYSLYNTVAFTMISGFSMSFLLWTILSSRLAEFGLFPSPACAKKMTWEGQ